MDKTVAESATKYIEIEVDGKMVRRYENGQLRDPDTGYLVAGTAKVGGIQRGEKHSLGVKVAQWLQEALDMHPGGPIQYFYERSLDEPKAFMALLGKFAPRDLSVTQDVGPTMLELLTRADARVKDAEAKPAKPLPPTT